MESFIGLFINFWMWVSESGGERILSPFNLGVLVLVIICWCIFAFMYLFLRTYDAHHHLAPERKVKEKNNSFRILYIFVGGAIIAEISSFVINNKENLEISTFFTKIFDINPEAYNIISTFCTIVAVLFVAYGLLMVVRGRIALDGFWGPEIYEYKSKGSALREYGLITSGVYSKMRHPIYCGQIIMAVATSFALNNRVILFFSIALIVSNCFRYKKEDQFLSEEFSEDWKTWSYNLYAFAPMPIKMKKTELGKQDPERTESDKISTNV